jgi:RNAse (barnase) inhibitor barstar
MSQTIIEIEGSKIMDLESFYNEIHALFCPKFNYFGRNLDALVDVLRGGFGVFPLGDKVDIIWKETKANRNLSKYSTIIDIFEASGHNFRIEKV